MEVEEERVDVGVDERSVDDLLSFINGRDTDHKCSRTSKNKKKNRRRKDPRKDPSSNDLNDTHKQDGANRSIVCKESGGTISSDPRRTFNLQDSAEDPFGADLDFEDDGMDDDLDPVMKEKLDREVEDFARRLKSDWLSLGQQRRLVPNIVNGNGSLQTYTGFNQR